MVQSRRRIYKWNFARQILWMMVLGMLLRDPRDLGSRGSWILILCFIVGSWSSCIFIFCFCSGILEILDPKPLFGHEILEILDPDYVILPWDPVDIGS